MNDNQLDQHFRQELGDYQASVPGADANWDRLQTRMSQGQHRTGAWWLWVLGLCLLGGGIALATMWSGWLTPPPLAAIVPLSSLDLPSEPLAAQPSPAAALPTITPDARLEASSAMALRPQSQLSSTAPAPTSPLGLSRSQVSDPPGPEHWAATAPRQRRPVEQASPPRRLEATDQTTAQPRQRVISTIDPVGPLATNQGFSPIAGSALTPDPLAPSKRPWRWLPRVGISLAGQQAQPLMGAITPAPVGLRLGVLEHGPWSLEVAAYADRYRQGTRFEQRGFYPENFFNSVSSDQELTADPAQVVLPPIGDTIRSLQVDAPGLLLPLSVRYAPLLSGRWQPFVEGGLSLRYQSAPSIYESYYTSRLEYDDDSPLTSDFVRVPDRGQQSLSPSQPTLRYAGWHLGLGTRLRLRPHLSVELAAYYQNRPAFDLPGGDSFQAFRTLGLRATFWWDR